MVPSAFCFAGPESTWNFTCDILRFATIADFLPNICSEIPALIVAIRLRLARQCQS